MNDEIKSFIERAGRLEEQKAELANDIKEIFAEAKCKGYDTKALRKAVKIWVKDATKRKQELDGLTILDTYLAQVGLK